MEDAKIAYLNDEILRLNKIINVLISQNDTLNAKIRHLETYIGSNNIIRPYDNNEIGAANANSPLLKSETGADNVVRPYDKIDIGSDNTSSPLLKNEIGSANVIHPYHKIEIGSDNVQHTIPKIEIGSDKVLPPLPYFIPLTPGNVTLLRNTIGKKFFFRVKRKGVTAMLEILLQVYNKGGCTYAELGRLTKRSHGGMSKLMASLKKRGLVQRTGKSKLQLTAQALDYFRKTAFDTTSGT